MNKTLTLYVGNLPPGISKSDLAQLIGHHARVVSVRLIRNRHDGRSPGYAFVEVAAEDAPMAVTILNGSLLRGRELTVTEALSRPETAAVPKG